MHAPSYRAHHRYACWPITPSRRLRALALHWVTVAACLRTALARHRARSSTTLSSFPVQISLPALVPFLSDSGNGDSSLLGILLYWGSSFNGEGDDAGARVKGRDGRLEGG